MKLLNMIKHIFNAVFEGTEPTKLNLIHPKLEIQEVHKIECE